MIKIVPLIWPHQTTARFPVVWTCENNGIPHRHLISLDRTRVCFNLCKVNKHNIFFCVKKMIYNFLFRQRKELQLSWYWGNPTHKIKINIRHINIDIRYCNHPLLKIDYKKITHFQSYILLSWTESIR